MSSLRLNIFFLFSLCMLLSLGGCSPGHTGSPDGDDDDDSAGDDDDDDSSGDDDDDSVADLFLTDAECDRICTERELMVGEGGACSFEATSGDCREVCTDHGLFERPTQDAFASCVATDPLCFMSIQDCVAFTVYPEGAPAELSLVGEGFEAVIGATVVAAVELTANDFILQTTEISAGGGFEVSWREEVWPDRSHLALYFVDVDGDGVCNPLVDLPGSSFMDRDSNIDQLSYAAVEERPGHIADFVCDYL